MANLCDWKTPDIKSHVRQFLKEIDFTRLRGILTSLNLGDVDSGRKAAHRLAETSLLAYLQTERRLPADVLTLPTVTRDDIIKYFEVRFEKGNLKMDKLCGWQDKKLQETLLKLWNEVWTVHSCCPVHHNT